MEERTVLRVREAADYLGLSSRTLEDWRWRRKGPKYVKLGRAIAYRLVDLEAWLDKQTITVEVR